jgi:beta-lactamase regulating signal transducer with metallopeptidase domain
MTQIALTLTPVVTGLVSATLKATSLLAMTALLVRALRHRAAALRHLIWTVALGAAIALLVLPTVLPAWRVVPVPAASPAAVRQYAPDVVRLPANRGAAEPARSVSAVDADLNVARQGDGALVAQSPLPARSIRAEWAALAFALWLVGVIAILGRYMWSRVSLERLARRSTLVERSVMDAQVVREMRIARLVCIRMSGDVDLPMTWGIVHPQIVLPADAVEWTPACRRHVLQHELAHIRRLDAATQLVAQAASALFWFNPLVWFAVGQMRRERERACDDCVLASGAVASDYAGDLLALVTSHGYADRHTVALAFARRSHFEARLLALLDPTVDRGLLSSRGVALTVGVSLALVAPLAAMQNAAARPARHMEHAQRTQGSPAKTPARTPVAPVHPATMPSSKAARHEETHIDVPAQSSHRLPDLFAPCTSASSVSASHHDSESSANGGTFWTASGEFGGCSFHLESEGEIGFNPDGTSIERISEGGYFDATTDIHGDVTRFSVRRVSDGTLAYQLANSGPRAGAPVASDVWLAQFLVGLDRTTAFAVARRFPVLIQSGGPPLVLSDIEQMYTSYAKYVYAERLLQSANLDSESLRRMAAVVSSMTTDHTAGELIVAIADHYPLTDPVVHAALLASALRMGVDHDWARSLLSIVTKSPLSPTEALAVLESVEKMTVDFEKTRVLLAMAASQRLDRHSLVAFTAAAQSIRQPYERDRAMAAIR